MLLPDTDPTHTGRTRGHYISLTLTSLTSALHLPSAISPPLSPPLSSPSTLSPPSPLSPGQPHGQRCGPGVDVPADSERVHGLLLRCHSNLSHLKGFIRGNEICCYIIP